MARLVFDIGGTHIRSAIFLNGSLKGKRIEDTPLLRKDLLNRIEEISKDYIKKYDVNSIGLSLAGKISKNSIETPHLPLSGLDIASFFSKKLSKKILLANDAKCAGLAENTYGLGKKYKNFVFLTIGTGIGGAIFINNKLYLGMGNAGEIGHAHFLGKEFEKYASGKKTFEIARKKGFKTEKELIKGAEKGNKKAIEIYREVGKQIGIGLSSLSLILDPECFIIGGGLSEAKSIYPVIEEEILKSTGKKLKVFRAKTGKDAGLIGAGLI